MTWGTLAWWHNRLQHNEGCARAETWRQLIFHLPVDFAFPAYLNQSAPSWVPMAHPQEYDKIFLGGGTDEELISHAQTVLQNIPPTR